MNIALDSSTRIAIIVALIVLFAVPKPSMATIKAWLAKLIPSAPSGMTLKSLLIPVVSIIMLLLPSETSIGPKPDPGPVVKTDTFDKCCEDYRELLVDIWYKYHATRNTMKDEAARLEFLNTQQVAAYTAAFQPYTDKAQIAGSPAGGADEMAKQLKERTF